MKLPRSPHSWTLAPREAIALQKRLSVAVRLEPLAAVRRVAGLDCAFLDTAAGTDILAVAVVWDVGAGRVLETRGARARVGFPYVPGLLSFREVPVLRKVLSRVVTPVDALLCDGQGIAHPRRFGLASHLGVITGLPSVGCAKSRLVGEHVEPGPRRGDCVPLLLRPPARSGGGPLERIGSVLRTRDNVKPLYVSPGHRCDHDDAVALVLACGAGYRLPEPTRLADREVARFKRAGRYRGGLSRAK